MNPQGQLFIGGQWRTGAGPELSSIAPSSGDVMWRGHAAAATDVDQAVRAARAAFPAWAELPFAEREKLARGFAALLEKNKEALARVIGRETGKPLWETRTEVAAMVGKIDISVRAYHARTGA